MPIFGLEGVDEAFSAPNKFQVVAAVVAGRGVQRDETEEGGRRWAGSASQGVLRPAPKDGPLEWHVLSCPLKSLSDYCNHRTGSDTGYS